MTFTRPEICLVVRKLPQFLTNPTKEQCIEVKHVLHYLKGTLDYK